MKDDQPGPLTGSHLGISFAGIYRFLVDGRTSHLHKFA